MCAFFTVTVCLLVIPVFLSQTKWWPLYLQKCWKPLPLYEVKCNWSDFESYWCRGHSGFFSAETGSKLSLWVPWVPPCNILEDPMASFEKFRLKDLRGELVRGGIGSGVRPSIFDVRRLVSVLETPCVFRSVRKWSPIMRIHTTELLLKFWSDRNSQLEIIELLRKGETLNSESGLTD